MTRSIRPITTCLVSLVTLIGIASAAPKKPRTYALREVLVEGSVTPDEKKKIDDELIKRFMLVVLDAGTAIEPERVQKLYGERPHLRECREKNCLVETGDYLAVDRLVSVVVEKSGAASGDRADWEVRMMLFAVDAVKYTDKQTMPCKQCTLDEVMRDFGNTVTSALKLDKTLPLCTVSVATAPPGGQVLVDGEPVGLAPFEHTVEAGKRTIGARSDASTKNELEIECPVRERRAVTFKLDSRGEKPEVVAMPVASATSSASSTNRGSVLKGVGGAMIAVGVLGFVGAGVAGAFNGKGTCDDVNCPFVRDTRGYIAGFAIGGTVFAGIGIGLVVKGILDSKRPARATSWIVAPQFGAQSVGAVGQFHY